MDIEKILKAGETERVEFKKSFGKETIISLVAFANSRDGRVVVGIDDNGRIKGFPCGPETVQQCFNEIKAFTYPQLSPAIDIHEFRGKTLLLLEINEYPIKPVACKNRYCKRVGIGSHALALNEIVELQQQCLNLSFDAYPLEEYLSSLDHDTMVRFFEKANGIGRANLRDDPLGNLTKLKIIKNGKPTLAAMLLFGNHGFSIHLGRFKSLETIIDDLMLKNPLPEAIEEAMIFIKKHINLSFDFDGSLQRKERWQYPLEALRELLLNAVVQRDYRNTSDIIIKIFDDHIVFSNPGKLFGNLAVEDLERDDYIPAHRNRLLAEAFYLTGDIEKYGTGFIRVRRMLHEYGDFTLNVGAMGDFFKVEVSAARTSSLDGTPTKTAEGTPEKTAGGIPEKTGEGTPEKTGEGTPEKTGEGTPTKTGEGTPTKTGEGTPEKTGEGTPEKTGEGTPTKTGEGTPTKTAEGAPEKIPGKTPEMIGEPLTALEEKIFDEIKRDNAITFEQIAIALSISRYTVVEYVGRLRRKGVVERRGGRRIGYWEILRADKENGSSVAGRETKG